MLPFLKKNILNQKFIHGCSTQYETVLNHYDSIQIIFTFVGYDSIMHFIQKADVFRSFFGHFLINFWSFLVIFHLCFGHFLVIFRSHFVHFLFIFWSHLVHFTFCSHFVHFLFILLSFLGHFVVIY